MSATGEIAELRRRHTEKLRDLDSRDKPRTRDDHDACMSLARELDELQAKIDRLEKDGQ